MDPFAANIGFLMMECDEAPMERVMTFHQERPVMLPNCDELACDWQTFKETYVVMNIFCLKLITMLFNKPEKPFSPNAREPLNPLNQGKADERINQI